MLLAPVAVGLALAAACIAAAFQDDVLGGSFGWRQPLGLLSAAAIGGRRAARHRQRSAHGRWHAPSLTLSSVLGQFPENPAEGDYRILWIGDPAGDARCRRGRCSRASGTRSPTTAR